MRAICCLAAILSVSAAGSFPVHAAPEPPSLPEITARLRQMPPHPRLFGGRGAESLRENAGTPMGKILAERILYDADEMLRVQPERRRMAGRSILMSSRRILYRVNTLSVAYLLSGEKKYAERAIREMLSAANFSDWNPGHFLDTAELTMALSIGYDFLYRELTPEQRSLIREAIVQKGLRPSLSGDRESCFWIDGVGNWVQVCHAGMVAGALVTFDPASGLSAELIQRAIRNMPKMVRHGYFPRGAYPEGPGYWNYGTQFHGAMIAMLESALGTDFGLLSLPGFDRTGEFIAAVTAPSGRLFNYSDCADNLGMEFGRVWWCGRYNRPDCFTTQLRRQFEENAALRPKNLSWELGETFRMMPLAMFFLANLQREKPVEPPLSYFSGNEATSPIAVHRSDGSGSAVYLGLKAGFPAAPHGHMDGGAFVLEADGVRWAMEFGIASYTELEKSMKMSLWDSRQGSGRYRVFFISPASHNILQIDGHEQRVDGKALFKEFHGAGEGQFSVMNLTPLYAGDAARVERKAALNPDRSVEISDHLEGLRPGASIRWQMCTDAEAAVEGRSLVLKKENRVMRLTADAPGEWRWEIVPMNRLAARPAPGWETRSDCLELEPDRPIRMVRFSVKAPADGKIDLRVRFAGEAK